MINNFFIGFKHGFQDFGRMIATGINCILLSIVYIVGVGPTALVARAFGKSFLDIKKEKKESYWKELGLVREPKENYYRQF